MAKLSFAIVSRCLYGGDDYVCSHRDYVCESVHDNARESAHGSAQCGHGHARVNDSPALPRQIASLFREGPRME